MKHLEFTDREEFEEYRDTKKAEMYETIWKSIDRAVATDERTAYIFEIYLKREQVYIDMVSEEMDWLHSLSLALNWYIKNEEYETCAHIQALIEKIKKLQE